MTYIPKRLREIVELHVYRNFAVSRFGPTPLILGIDGPPGEGKTFSVSAVLADAGVNSFLISGGQMESPHSGKPSELIRDTYIQAGSASSARDAKPHPATVVINDIDGGIGDWGPSVQYTVNRQNVITELMSICDHPTVIEGRDTPRVPLIVTGNDFSRLYEPLIRSGRFRRFTWVPTFEEKVGVVETLLPVDMRGHATRLVQQFSDHPISFFSDIVAFTQDHTITTALRQRGFRNAMEGTLVGSYPRIETALTIDALESTGRALALQHTNKSHLG